MGMTRRENWYEELLGPFAPRTIGKSGAGKDQACLVLISDDIPEVNETREAIHPDSRYFIR